MTKTNDIKNFERLHIYYQKLAYRMLIKDFRKMLASIPYDNLNYEFPEAVIALNVNDEALEKSMFNLYKLIGLRYGKQVGADLNKFEREQKDIPFPLFSEKFLKFISNYFLKEGGKKVRSLTETMTNKVLKIIKDASNEGLTQAQMAKLVQETVNKPNFYRYNAMRIARTESLFAMNSAKVTSFENNSFVVDKIWIQGGSRHPRADHSIMDGTKVGESEYFTLPNGERALYPGDKSLSAEQVINCSCTIAYAPKRNAEGDLIYK